MNAAHPAEPPDTSRPRIRPGTAAIALLMITALGAGLRLWDINRRSLWVDEGQTGYMAMLPPGDMVDGLRAGDSHGVLPYTLCRWALDAWPWQIWALRLPSAVAGILAIPLFYLLAAELLRSRAGGLVAAAALAINRFHIHHSQEARNYALFFLATVAAMACLARLTRPADRGRSAMDRPAGRLALWVGFALASAAMIYTHNVAFLFLATLMGYYAIACWLGRPGRWWRPIVDVTLAGGAIALLYLPWVPTLLAQFRTIQDGCWIPAPTPASVAQAIGMMAWYPPAVPVDRIADAAISPGRLFEIGVLFGGITLVAGAAGLTLSIFGRDRRLILMVAALVLAVAGVLVASVVGQPIFMAKVAIPLVAAWPLGLAALVARGRRPRAALIGVGVLLIAGAVLATLAAKVDVQEQWGPATELAIATVEPNDGLIIVDNDFHVRTVAWYVHGTRYGPVRGDRHVLMLLGPGGSVPNPTGVGWPDNAHAALLDRLRPGQMVCVIERDGHRLAENLQALLAETGELAGRRQFSRCSVTTWQIERRPGEPVER